MSQPDLRPLIYEVHTRQWLARFGRELALHAIPELELDRLAGLGVTHLWLMGVWQTGAKSREQALISEGLREQYGYALPGWTPDDVAGSPYAIAAYQVDPVFGGDPALARLRTRLAARGIALLLDFVPNHLGLDHEWLCAHPERFVGADHWFEGSLAVAPTRYVAHGKDPYFPAWTDTVQLDYRRSDTQQAMTEQLLAIADRCDGVRCDMAMLLLAEVFAATWRHLPCADGSEFAAGQFWSRAIGAVRQAHPGFLWIAEAYWGLEQALCDLGFDATYDKTLYDRLIDHLPSDVQRHLLGLGPQLARGVHFLENHDEPRISTRLGLARHRAAAALILGLPGMTLIHDGQLEGLRRFARIQLARRAGSAEDPEDPEIRACYVELLHGYAASAVGRGQALALTPNPAWQDNPTSQCFAVVQWQAASAQSGGASGSGELDLVVVNLAPHRAQCRVPLSARGLAGHRWQLVDRLGSERWERDGDELAGPGLYLDLPPYGAQLFSCTRVP